MTKSFAERYSNYLGTKIVSKKAVQIESNPIKKEATKQNKKGEKEMKKSNKTNKTTKGENTMKKEINTKENTKMTLTQRVERLENTFALQKQFNGKMVEELESIENRFSKFNEIIGAKAPKQIATSTTKSTKNKETKKESSPSKNSQILTEKLSKVTTKKLGIRNAYAIVNHCFKTLKNNKKKIAEYIEYNKANHRASVNKIVDLYLTENLAQYMAR